MIGALVGDIAGSRYEFNNIKTKNFQVIDEECYFTDDSAMSIAVMDWCLHAKDHSDEKEATSYLQKWGRKYPDAGYGGRFYWWLKEDSPKPYHSCGNGSAMRISAVGWLFEDHERMVEASSTITGITHNHPEGMKGALVTAEMIYKARHGASKEELKEYAIKEYPEIATLDYEELRKTYEHGLEICQVTLPQALYCFLISKDFEDCLKTTISIGGDCDTTSAISCAIAEAYYGGVDASIRARALDKLPEDMKEILKEAENKFEKGE